MNLTVIDRENKKHKVAGKVGDNLLYLFKVRLDALATRQMLIALGTVNIRPALFTCHMMMPNHSLRT